MILVSMIVITSEDGSVITDPIDLCLDRLGFEVHKTSFGILLALSGHHTSEQVSCAVKGLSDTYKGKYRYNIEYKQYDESKPFFCQIKIPEPSPGEAILDYRERKERKDKIEKIDKQVKTWNDLFDPYRQCK